MSRDLAARALVDTRLSAPVQGSYVRTAGSPIIEPYVKLVVTIIAIRCHREGTLHPRDRRAH